MLHSYQSVMMQSVHTPVCRQAIKILVLLVAFQGLLCWEFSQSCKWDSHRILQDLNRFVEFLSPDVAEAADLNSSCDECDGKVTQLTLRYTGMTAAKVTIVQKKDDILLFDDIVGAGSPLTFSGIDKYDTMGTEIRLFVNGDLNTKIHTSCSKPIGPGLISGDFEVIAGLSSKGGRLCPLPPAPDCSECEGKVSELTLKYMGSESAQIRVTDKKDKNVLFDEAVGAGEAFTFSGMDKNGTMGSEIRMYIGSDLDTEIHTSCSKLIGPGLISGNFQVIEGYSRKGGKLCAVPPPPECGECDGKVTELSLRYMGTESTHIKVIDKKGENALFEDAVGADETFTFSGMDKNGTMGSEIRLYVNDGLNTSIHTSCSKPIGPGLISGDFEVIEGYSRKGGELCPIPPLPDCGDCKGKVTVLTLRYMGTKAVQVDVYQKKDDMLLYSEPVEPFEAFTFYGMDKNGTMSSEIRLYVDEVFHNKIHTSCSKPIGRGLAVGDFVVIEGYSRKGGKLCPLPGSDNDLPTISAQVTPSPNAAGWNNSDVTVSFECSDITSGVASCPDPVVVASEGADQAVTGTVIDHAGNSATQTVSVNLDRTPPEIVATASPPPNAEGWNNTDVTVTFACTDAMSGIEACPDPSLVNTEGVGQSVPGAATDKAGNTGQLAPPVVLNIDRTPPEIVATASPPPNAE
ncbi:hypothetical protein ACFL0M_08370, partial [Thermodesulfobacteriota bacterium]